MKPEDRADERGGGALPRPDSDELATAPQLEASTVDLPKQIGPYRIVRRLGVGGMGEVFEAEQVEPIRRRVALKLVKAGLDSESVVARFESERQALAIMEHPAIARVFDAGTTERGRPYFVMEYVPGIPINEHCDRDRMTTRDRLELFIRVCEGVQHAHHKAIIHRDLKPSNILVAVQDGDTFPKIIDFGVARATAQRLIDAPARTEIGQMIGTPEYMSPEQAEMSAQEVDTRTDVYSLGVVLYELLVGALPFDSHVMRGAAFDDLRRMIREIEPPRPSTRASSLGAESDTSADARRMRPREWVGELRGELDWITMKALEKDRTRRYASPGDLAADIRRHLADEPVEAGPPSATYRLGKLVRRHRLAVSAATLVAVALVAGLSAALWGLVAAQRAEVVATREARTSNEVSEFLVNLFEASDPGEAKGEEVTARELLDRGRERIEEQLGDEPETRAALLETMGRVYTSLGAFPEASEALESALEIRERHAPGNPLALATGFHRMAELRGSQGRGEEAADFARRAIAIRERELGPNDLLVAEALNALGNAFNETGPPDSAEVFHRRSLEIREAAGDRRATGKSLHNLANSLLHQGKYEEAETIYRRAIEIQEDILGPDHYGLGTTIHVLAICCQAQGRLDEAVELEKRSLAIREKSLGPDHWHVGLSLTTLGNILVEQGKAEEAEPRLRRAAEIARESLGAVAGDGRWMVRSHARCLGELERYAEAEHVLVELMRAIDEEVGDESYLTPNLNALGEMLIEAGELERAQDTLRRSLAIERRVSGEDSDYLVEALVPLGRACHRAGKIVEARAHYARAAEIAGTWPEDDQDRRAAEREYAAFLAAVQ